MLNCQVTRRQVVPDAKVPLGAIEDVLDGLRSQALLGHAWNTPGIILTIPAHIINFFCAVLSLAVTIDNDIEASCLFAFVKPNLDVGVIIIVFVNDTAGRRRAVLPSTRRDFYTIVTALLLV